ncbi:MAG: class I SAM-dependent methyltransferase [Candidatus Riflebacteria bacterium]|nr:class I SAM-dependent methyltransferase [Candidatus Riflebacteria bacterium]
MNTVKEHYENHLGNFYSWMTGDIVPAVKSQEAEFKELKILPQKEGNAIDLGSGHGIQALALDSLGFNTTAIDFNSQLLCELEKNSVGSKIRVVNDDILNVQNYKSLRPEIISCCGDTISHLHNLEVLGKFFADCNKTLIENGRIFLTFRDYSNELSGTQRFLPVKSDDFKILTCVLDFSKESVQVTDLLYEKKNGSWVMNVSSYEKIRLTVGMVESKLLETGFLIEFKEAGRMNTLLARKK